MMLQYFAGIKAFQYSTESRFKSQRILAAQLVPYIESNHIRLQDVGEEIKSLEQEIVGTSEPLHLSINRSLFIVISFNRSRRNAS
jgi:hypothetical protein